MILNSRRKSFSKIGMFLRDFLTLGGKVMILISKVFEDY